MKPRRGQAIGGGGGGGGILFSSLGLNAGDPFTVLAGATVILDVDTPSLGYTDIAGTVRKDTSFRTLTTTGINVANGGLLELGTAAAPATWAIVLTGAYVPLVNTVIAGLTVATNAGTSRAILVQPGGTLRLHGTSPAVLYTFLNAHAAVADVALTCADTTGWLAGDNVIVANTEFPEVAAFPTPNRDRSTEGPFQLGVNASGTTLTLPSGLTWAKWGRLQYPVDVLVSGSGFALTQNTFSAKKASVDVPDTLDERARIANLTRGGSISCPNDTDFTQKGHGVHIMGMSTAGNPCVMELEGFTLRRCGQRGAIGRYPIHWHIGSYTVATGAFTQDLTASYARKVVVWDSENRAFTIHATCGVEVSDCLSFNVKGHAYFLEDGSERRNKIYRDMAFATREPRGPSAMPGAIGAISGNGTTTSVTWNGHGLWSGQVITVTGASSSGFNVFRCPVTVVDANHFTYPSTGSGTPSGTTIVWGDDHIKAHDLGSSGFWITNMDNDIQDPYASDAVSGDLNNSPTTSNGVWCSLATQCFGFSANVAINPQTLDILVFKGVVAHSNYGLGLKFAGPVGDEAGNFNTLSFKYNPSLGVVSTDHRLWKNTINAYFNQVGITKYKRWITVDNGNVNGADFNGSTNNGGLSDDHLICGTSLNNAVPTSPDSPYPHAGFIPYHGTLAFHNCTFVNLPYGAPVFTNPIDKGFGGGCNSGGTDGYDQPGIDVVNGLNTGHKLINSHPGPIAVPLDLDGRNTDDPGGSHLSTLNRHYSIAAVQWDIDGKFGTPGKFILPITPATGLVDARYLTGATNVVDGPTTGTVVCKTTDTRYFGAGCSDGAQMMCDTMAAVGAGAQATVPLTITRQAIIGGATIGTPQVIKNGIYGGVPQSFLNYRSFAVQAGARYKIDFTDGASSLAAPSSYMIFDLCNANVVGDFVVLGLPWAASAVPRICMGSHFSLETLTYPDSSAGFNITANTFASTTAITGDVATKKAIVCTTAATGATSEDKIAAVAADTTGQTYFRDTATNHVWVRYTLPAGGVSYPANLDPHGTVFNMDIQQIIIKV